MSGSQRRWDGSGSARIVDSAAVWKHCSQLDLPRWATMLAQAKRTSLTTGSAASNRTRGAHASRNCVRNGMHPNTETESVDASRCTRNQPMYIRERSPDSTRGIQLQTTIQPQHMQQSLVHVVRAHPLPAAPHTTTPSCPAYPPPPGNCRILPGDVRSPRKARRPRRRPHSPTGLPSNSRHPPCTSCSDMAIGLTNLVHRVGL